MSVTVDLRLGDCMEIMRDLPDGCVDAVVTDPPYGMTDLALDRYGEKWIGEALRLTKAHGQLCCFGGLPTLSPILQTWHFRWGGVWVKPNSGPRSHNAKKPKSRHEWFAVFCKHGVRPSDLTFNQQVVDGEPFVKVQRNRGWQRDQKDSIDRMDPRGFTEDGYLQVNPGTRIVTDVIEGPSKPYMGYSERTIHPTQKPVSIIQTIIEWLTDERQIVLDPFMGSGTTGVACVRTGRNFIGIEIDPQYFAIAERRIAEAQRNYQPQLALV
jgi:site-specific DNA-methyltransferase (adenine-specific)